jgi:CRP-like cAMP-binding protein
MLHLQREAIFFMDYSSVLIKTALFRSIGQTEITGMLDCLNTSVGHYKKGSYILAAGEAARNIGIMLQGQATVYKDDILGNRTVIALIEPSDMFAESFLCAGITASPVTVEAAADSDILLLPFERIIKTCSSCCTYHNSLIENMLGIIARKNIMLSEKIDHIAKRTTRQKLASYLMGQATQKGGNSFSIGLDRQGLADYLCVNRSALSRELSGIAEQGIIDYRKDRFTIKDLKRLEDMLQTE